MANTIDLVLPSIEEVKVFTVDFGGTGVLKFEYDGFFEDKVTKKFNKHLITSMPKESINTMVTYREDISNGNLDDVDASEFGEFFVAQEEAVEKTSNDIVETLFDIVNDVELLKKVPEQGIELISNGIVNKIINSGFGLN